LVVAFEGSADLGHPSRWEGEDSGFAPLAVRQGRAAVGFTLEAAAIELAALAAEADEGAAEDGGDRERFHISVSVNAYR
jgi:hypothetical protein